MKRGIILLLLSILTIIPSYAQKQNTSGIFHINLNGIFNETNIQESIKDKFKYTPNATYNLTSNISLMNQVKTEGMSNITIEKYQLRIVLLNNEGDSFVTLSYFIKGKNDGNNSGKQSALNEFYLKSGKFQLAIDSIYNYLTNKFNTNCSYLSYDANATANELKKVMADALFTPSWSSCAKQSQKVSSELQKLIDRKTCPDKIHHLQILVESRTYNTNSAIQELSSIDKNSICAKEALDIAKKIGSQKKEVLDKTQIKILNAYISKME